MRFFTRIKNFLTARFARYDAATQTIRRSYVPGALQDVRLDITKATREEIMRKARYFEKNNAIARRIGSVHCDFTVGSGGMVFNPNSSDSRWNSAARAYWEKTQQVIDLNTRQTFGSLQQLIAWRDLFDGDIFILKTRGQDNAGRLWPRIQIIEAHRCKTPDQRKTDEGKSIVDGVELDANGRPTGYWFTAGEDGAMQLYDAKNVIAILDPDRANQVRGLSAFAAALNYLHQLNDLQDLEMRAAADAAEKSTFIRTQNGQLPPGMGGTVGKFRDTAIKTGAVQTTDASTVVSAIGGRAVALNMGEDVTQFQPARPTEATRALWSYLTSCVCAAAGTSKLVCFSEWLDGAQGTVVRGDYDIAAQNYRARAAVYAAAFREVYLYVLSWGIVTEKSLSDPPADWTNVITTAPRAVNVDVGRNAAAIQNDLLLGLTNHELIYGERGLDARTEITRQIEFLAFVKKKCAEISAREGVVVESDEVLGEIIYAGEPASPSADPSHTNDPIDQ